MTCHQSRRTMCSRAIDKLKTVENLKVGRKVKNALAVLPKPVANK